MISIIKNFNKKKSLFRKNKVDLWDYLEEDQQPKVRLLKTDAFIISGEAFFLFIFFHVLYFSVK